MTSTSPSAPHSSTPSPFGPITPEDLTASISNTIIIVAACLTGVAIVAVGCRIWARHYTRQPLRWDDWLIFAAVPLAIADCIATSYAAANGTGRHIYTLTPEEIPRWAQAFIASEILWASTVPVVKASVVLLYVRIFGTLRYFRRFAWALTIFNVCWGVMVCLVCAFQCIPLAAVWDPTITDKRCIDAGLFFIIGSVPDFLTDVLIVVLPIPAVWSLHTSTTQKIGLSGVFLLGSFTCVTSLIRFASLCMNATNPDVTWGLGSVAIWSMVEISIGITAACLPTIWPLIVRAFPALRTFGGTTQQKKYIRGGAWDFERGRSGGASYKMSKGSHDGYLQFSSIETNIVADESGRDKQLPVDGIQVKSSTVAN